MLKTVERELLPMAWALDIGTLAWSPLASGLLSGKYTRATSDGGTRRLDTVDVQTQYERNLDIAKTVDTIADEMGRTSAQVALNWVRQQTNVIPVIGARKEAHIKDNLACLEFTLTAEQLARLHEVSQIELGFPYDFLKSRRESILGFTATQHLIGSHVVNIQGNMGECRAHFQATHIPDEEQWVLGGHYHFQLQHTDEAWHIVAITLTINYP